MSVSQAPVPVPTEAISVAQRLRAALAMVGFDVDRDFENCRADVTTSGQGFVTIGRLSVTTAERLSEALEAGTHTTPTAHVAQRLRAALVMVGFDVDRDFENCRADVTTSGQGFVTIGRLSVTTAERLSEALEAGTHTTPTAHDEGRVGHADADGEQGGNPC